MAEEINSYLTVEEADDLAETIFGLDTFKAGDEDERAQRLVRATARVDAVRFQGRKYEATQVREFPRVDGCTVIDVDPETNLPMVPSPILLAVLYEADAMGSADDLNRGRRADGLASQSVGGMSESYVAPASNTASPFDRLCADARQQLEKYKLRSGAML